LKQSTQTRGELQVAPDVRHQLHGRVCLFQIGRQLSVMDNRPARVNREGNSTGNSHRRGDGLFAAVAPLRR